MDETDRNELVDTKHGNQKSKTRNIQNDRDRSNQVAVCSTIVAGSSLPSARPNCGGEHRLCPCFGGNPPTGNVSIPGDPADDSTGLRDDHYHDRISVNVEK